MYAAVVQLSYSMTTRLLPYGLSLSSSVAGRPGCADILGWLLPRMVCMLRKSIHIQRNTWQVRGYGWGFAWNSSRSGRAVPLAHRDRGPGRHGPRGIWLTWTPPDGALPWPSWAIRLTAPISCRGTTLAA